MPNAKKQRGKKKKAGAGAAAAAAPKRPPGTAAAASRIETANAILDLSKGLEPFLSIDLPGGGTADPVRLEIRSPKTLGAGDAQGMYDLLKGNMHDMYVEAGWGWNKAEKWREMGHRDARFLIARCGGGGGETACDEGGKAGGVASAIAGVGGVSLAEDKEIDGAAVSNDTVGADEPGTDGGGKAPPVAGPDSAEKKPAPAGGDRLAGYCHFRFAWDQDENEDGEGVGGVEDVLYVYELQVAPWAKRRGLGRRMMQALELLANRHGMTKVMLTVFKENRQAMSFYTTKMKYCVDKDSPSNWDQPDEVYEILSKPTRQGLARANEAKRAATLLDFQ